MFVVGLTGGIGSGKSAASEYFKQLGITIVDADIAARTVVKPGTKTLEKIAQHFGRNILQSNGELNRPALREVIFSAPEQKRWLEALLHPLIREQMEQDIKAATSDYVILSAPLLLEGELHKRCNRIAVVDLPESLQIERTVLRDKSNKAHIEKIIRSQISREQRLQAADDIVDNSGSTDQLQQQVKQLHDQYLEYARQKTNHS